MHYRWLIVLAVLAGCAATDKRVTPAPVVAAERAFAADGAKRGWAAAFRSYAAPEAIMLSPDPINAHESLAKVEGDGETTLDWRPAYAGISRSGDFGFTTGPFLIRGLEGVVGHYFTVWRLQSDGTWKWIFDAGTDVVDTSPVALNEDIPGLPVATMGAATPQAAVADIAELEAKHTSSATLVKLLADDARVHRPFARARHRHRRGRSAVRRRRRDELCTAAARGGAVGRHGLLDGRGPRPARGRRASALLRANLAATPGRLADRFRRDRPATRLSGPTR